MSANAEPKPASQPKNAVGTIADAETPFADALIAAAKAVRTESPGDPRVTAGVQLGWVMESIIGARRQTPLPSDFPLYAETLDRAKAIELARLLGQLKLTIQAVPAALVKALEEDGQHAGQAALDWEDTLVAALLGAGVRLAKAYGVGRQLNVLAYGRRSVASGATASVPVEDRVAGMLASLDDLSTVLPSHAARGVANSVRRWPIASLEQPGNHVLQAQCELWCSALTGEKKATELLEPENYLDAAEQLAVKLRATATTVLKQNAVWVALIVVLFVIGGVVLLFVPASSGKTAAGLSAVLAALGLSWKGIGGTLGKLAGNLEAPLWGAEVDGAVTDAITLWKAPPVAPQTKKARLTSALKLQRRRRDIVGDYADRTLRRPGVDPGPAPPPEQPTRPRAAPPNAETPSPPRAPGPS